MREWRDKATGRQGDKEILVFVSSSPCRPVAPSPTSSVHSCHHTWTASLKLIISCGHIFVPIYEAASSICGISSVIYSLSLLSRRLVVRWHARCFTLKR